MVVNDNTIHWWDAQIINEHKIEFIELHDAIDNKIGYDRTFIVLIIRGEETSHPK